MTGLLIPGNDLPPSFYAPLARRLGVLVPSMRGFCGEPAHAQPGWGSTLAEVGDLFDGGVLLGHSFGGLVAFLLAARIPDRVERLVLLEPPIIASPRAARWVHRRYVRRTVAGDRSRFYNRSGLTRRIADPASFPAERMRDYMEARGRADSRTLRTLLQEMGQQMPLPFERVDMPVLVLRGARSGWGTFFGMRALVRRLPNARLETIPDAAHMMVNENDDRLEEVIHSFCGPRRSEPGPRADSQEKRPPQDRR